MVVQCPGLTWEGRGRAVSPRIWIAGCPDRAEHGGHQHHAQLAGAKVEAVLS